MHSNGCIASESVITIANKHWDLGMGDIRPSRLDSHSVLGDGGMYVELQLRRRCRSESVFGRVIPEIQAMRNALLS